MKSLNVKVLAVVLGIAGALASQSATSKTDDPVYGRTPEGEWIRVTSTTESQRACVSSEDACKAAFSSNPNSPGAEMTELIEDNGVYALIPGR